MVLKVSATNCSYTSSREPPQEHPSAKSTSLGSIPRRRVLQRLQLQFLQTCSATCHTALHTSYPRQIPTSSITLGACVHFLSLVYGVHASGGSPLRAAGARRTVSRGRDTAGWAELSMRARCWPKMCKIQRTFAEGLKV